MERTEASRRSKLQPIFGVMVEGLEFAQAEVRRSPYRGKSRRKRSRDSGYLLPLQPVFKSIKKNDDVSFNVLVGSPASAHQTTNSIFS